MTMIAEVNPQQLFLVAAIAILIVVLMRRWNRYFSRQDRGCSSAVRPARPETESSASAATPNELARWEVRMHDLARDLSGQLDSKMGALEHLIRDADRAAARLEKALAAARSDPTDPSAADQAEKLKTTDPAEPELLSAADAPADDLTRDQRYEEIYTLSDYGLEPSEIAQRVGSPVGEVELILGLRGGK